MTGIVDPPGDAMLTTDIVGRATQGLRDTITAVEQLIGRLGYTGDPAVSRLRSIVMCKVKATLQYVLHD